MTERERVRRAVEHHRRTEVFGAGFLSIPPTSPLWGTRWPGADSNPFPHIRLFRWLP